MSSLISKTQSQEVEIERLKNEAALNWEQSRSHFEAQLSEIKSQYEAQLRSAKFSSHRSPFGSPVDNTDLSPSEFPDESSVALSVSMTQKQPHPAILITNMASTTGEDRSKSATLRSNNR